MRYHYVITLRSTDGKYGTVDGFIQSGALADRRSKEYRALRDQAAKDLRFRDPSVIFFSMEPDDLLV